MVLKGINRKAQVEWLIPAIPIFIIIFLIMALFVFLSAAAGVIKGPKAGIAQSIRVPDDSLLFRTIEVQFPQQQKKEVLIIDAIHESLSKKISISSLHQTLAKFIQGEIKCAIISVDTDHIAAYYHPSINEVKTEFFESGDKLYETLDNLGYKIRIHQLKDTMRYDIVVNEKKHQILAYYGKCLNE